jgi:ankyrin repeat protein
VEHYNKAVNIEKKNLISALGVCPVSKLRLTCLMLACRFVPFFTPFHSLSAIIFVFSVLMFYLFFRFGASNLLSMMRQIFSLCYELYVSEFFEEQELFDNLLKLEDSNGQTVLYHAIRSGDKDCIQALLSHNISPIDRFNAANVTRSTCVCDMGSLCKPETPSDSPISTCFCQPSRSVFPFLIMSLDLHPILKTCAGHQASFSQSSSPPSFERLSNSVALGEYRILDLDIFTASIEDSKGMWRRCIENIESFSHDNANEKSAFQFEGRIYTQMCFNPIHNKGIGQKLCVEMHSSFINAKTRFSTGCYSGPNSVPHNSSDMSVHLAFSIQRLMFFSFCLLSDGLNTDVTFHSIIQQMKEIAESVSETLAIYQPTNIFDTNACAASQPFFSVSDGSLDVTSSLLFMLANSLFNGCVALKITHCTKVTLFLSHLRFTRVSCAVQPSSSSSSFSSSSSSSSSSAGGDGAGAACSWGDAALILINSAFHIYKALEGCCLADLQHHPNATGTFFCLGAFFFF